MPSRRCSRRKSSDAAEAFSNPPPPADSCCHSRLARIALLVHRHAQTSPPAPAPAAWPCRQNTDRDREWLASTAACSPWSPAAGSRHPKVLSQWDSTAPRSRPHLPGARTLACACQHEIFWRPSAAILNEELSAADQLRLAGEKYIPFPAH